MIEITDEQIQMLLKVLKTLKEHKKKPPKDKQPPNTCIPAVIAAVL